MTAECLLGRQIAARRASRAPVVPTRRSRRGPSASPAAAAAAARRARRGLRHRRRAPAMLAPRRSRTPSRQGSCSSAAPSGRSARARCACRAARLQDDARKLPAGDRAAIRVRARDGSRRGCRDRVRRTRTSPPGCAPRTAAAPSGSGRIGREETACAARPGRSARCSAGQAPAPRPGWPSPPCSRRRRAGTDSRRAAAGSRPCADRGVFHFENTDYRNEPSPAPELVKTGQQFTSLAPAPVLLSLRAFHV